MTTWLDVINDKISINDINWDNIENPTTTAYHLMRHMPQSAHLIPKHIIMALKRYQIESILSKHSTLITMFDQSKVTDQDYVKALEFKHD